jgi:hypothetical protein
MTYTDVLLFDLVEFLKWSKWLFILAVALTTADLRFGIQAARYRGEKIKKSRAVRRTLNKIFEYFLWVVTAYPFGKVFGKPFGIDLLPLLILLFVYGIELESIYVNYFESKGRKVKVSFLKLFKSKTTLIEVEEKEKEKEKEKDEDKT